MDRSESRGHIRPGRTFSLTDTLLSHESLHVHWHVCPLYALSTPCGQWCSSCKRRSEPHPVHNENFYDNIKDIVHFGEEFRGYVKVDYGHIKELIDCCFVYH